MEAEKITNLEKSFLEAADSMPGLNGLFDFTKENLSRMKEHDTKTYLHQLRVALIAKRLAEISKEKDLKAEFYGGANHDSGKLDVPEALLKAEKITENEYELIKRHALSGAKMLADYLFVSLIAGMHHGFQKGSYGLTKEEIYQLDMGKDSKERVLRAATNVALADFFDAMKTRKSHIAGGDEEKGIELVIKHFPAEEAKIRVLFNDPVAAEIVGPFSS